MSDSDEWISSADALALLNSPLHTGAVTICTRAHVGLINARAERFIRNNKVADNVAVPAEFWWAKGERALYQNWTTGDFETWIDHEIHLQAFGVSFRRSDIERAKLAINGDRRSSQSTRRTGQKIFIGHGRSNVWRELKEFLETKLHLETDEFNRVPTAGLAITERLEEMLDAASLAFLVLTAEDQTPGGTFNARLNVIHEAGLFQGRLGFKKAIVLVEEGCEVFSNIHGLVQIRFPAGTISAKFEDIRDVLKRENLIN